MYPRVMVRDCEDKTPIKEETSSYLVSYMESLSLEGPCSSRTSCHGGASKCDAPRLAKNVKPPPGSSLSASPASKAKNSKDVDVVITKHTRASSLPQPRAVLSSPDNDEIIGNLNELNRKRETVTILELQNHKNHAQAASKISGKQFQKGETPLRTRPLGQNKNAQVSAIDVRLTTPRRTREITFGGCKNTHLVEKPASDLTPKLGPTIRSRIRDIGHEGCRKSKPVEKVASDLTPKLRPIIRNRIKDISLEGSGKIRLVDKLASDLTPKLRPAIRSRTRDIAPSVNNTEDKTIS